MPAYDAPPSHEADPKPELGHLVEGFDFRRLTAWAQEQAVAGNSDDANPLAAIPIRINGVSATVGSLKSGGEGFKISSQEVGRRNVFIVEGSADIQVFKHWPRSNFLRDNNPPVVKVTAQDEVPAHIHLGIIDYFHVHGAEGPQDKAWFVALFEVPESIQPIA